MPFQVVSPMVMNLDGSDFTEAVKNFVKLNRHLNINELILTDNIDYMRANIRYYNNGGGHKASIRIRPTQSRALYNIPGTSMGFVGQPVVTNTLNSGIFGPVAPFGGVPSAVIGPDGAVRDVAPVVPVSAVTGKPIRPAIGVPASNIIGVGARGPIVAPGFGVPIYPGPISFAPASSLVEWVDSATDKKLEHSDEIEKAYANLKDKNVTITATNLTKYALSVTLQFKENECVISYSTAATLTPTIINAKRKGPATPRIMVAPRMFGPFS